MEYDGPVRLPPGREPSLREKLHEFFLTPEGYAVGMLILFAFFIGGLAFIHSHPPS